jgi:hypothetical protein
MLKIARYVLGAGLMIGATAASAGDLVPDAADGIMNSCRPDYHRVCGYVVPGEGRAARCLLDHQREIAPSCLLALRIASAVEDCMPDYERYCRGVPKGSPAFQCLADKIDRLVPACRRVVDANAPYMLPREGRYADNRGADPYYRAPAPYSRPAPYGGQYPGAYAYREEPGAGNYGAPGEPQGQPYQAPPYRGQPYQSQPYQGQQYQGQTYQSQPYTGNPYPDPRYGSGYAYSGPPREPNDPYRYHYGPGNGGRYAEGAPRFRSYDDSNGGDRAGSFYDAPRAPY